MQDEESINDTSSYKQDIKFDWRAVTSEFVGTTVFVFIGTTTIVFAQSYEPPGAAQVLHIALGHIFALLCMIHTFGPISGGHFNPAVTFATMVTRHIGALQGVLYVVAQLFGGIAGAALTLLIGGKTSSNLGAFALKDPADYLRGFTLEVMLTFILVLTIFGSAVKAQHISGDYGLEKVVPVVAGLNIACALGACIMAGTLTGACMNPARALGPELLSWSWHSYSWIYYSAPWIGGLMAGLLFEFIVTKPRSSYLKLPSH